VNFKLGFIKEFEASFGDTDSARTIRVVLGDLACVILINIISSPVEHSLVLGLPWFELHNPNIDWRKRTIEKSSKVPTKDK
jgi:hypothetical protein